MGKPAVVLGAMLRYVHPSFPFWGVRCPDDVLPTPQRRCGGGLVVL